MLSDKATMWIGIGVGAACMIGGGILQHHLPGGTARKRDLRYR